MYSEAFSKPLVPALKSLVLFVLLFSVKDLILFVVVIRGVLQNVLSSSGDCKASVIRRRQALSDVEL